MILFKSCRFFSADIRKSIFPFNRILTVDSKPKLINFFKPSAISYSDDGPSHFLSYNNVVYPPQLIGEEPRPAFVCHQKLNIKYPYKKLYYIACFIRGMSIDEAIKQLKQVPRKGAFVIIDTLKEAQDLAVKEHNVEFKSNLWVAESFVGKGLVIKGIRRHARCRMGEIRYQYTHYFVRLEEGQPPEKYYWAPPTDGPSLLQKYINELRNRKIVSSL